MGIGPKTTPPTKPKPPPSPAPPQPVFARSLLATSRALPAADRPLTLPKCRRSAPGKKRWFLPPVLRHEPEAALHGVMVLEIDVEPVLWKLRLVLRRLADVGGRAGDVGEHGIVKRRLPCRSLDRRQLRLDHRADLQAASAFLYGEGDGGSLHCQHLSDELSLIGQGATQFPCKGVHESFLLLRGGLVVHVHHEDRK